MTSLKMNIEDLHIFMHKFKINHNLFQTAYRINQA